LEEEFEGFTHDFGLAHVPVELKLTLFLRRLMVLNLVFVEVKRGAGERGRRLDAGSGGRGDTPTVPLVLLGERVGVDKTTWSIPRRRVGATWVQTSHDLEEEFEASRTIRNLLHVRS